jgi:hypothetical protein
LLTETAKLLKLEEYLKQDDELRGVCDYECNAILKLAKVTASDSNKKILLLLGNSNKAGS